MLKEHVLILKNIMKLQLEQSSFQLKNFIKKYNNNMNRLKKILLLYNAHKNMLHKNLMLGLDILTLNIYYKSLLDIEKELSLCKLSLFQDINQIKKEKLLWKISNRKLQTWNILNDRIVSSNNRNKKYLLRRYWNEYYQFLSLKNFLIKNYIL